MLNFKAVLKRKKDEFKKSLTMDGLSLEIRSKTFHLKPMKYSKSDNEVTNILLTKFSCFCVKSGFLTFDQVQLFLYKILPLPFKVVRFRRHSSIIDLHLPEVSFIDPSAKAENNEEETEDIDQVEENEPKFEEDDDPVSKLRALLQEKSVQSNNSRDSKDSIEMIEDDLKVGWNQGYLKAYAGYAANFTINFTYSI